MPSVSPQSHTVSATEAKNRFGTMLQRVARDDAPLIVERGGKPVAVLMSIAAYEATRRAAATPSRSRRELAQEAIGMWANRDDIEDDWLQQSREQWSSRWPQDR
jgi:prevent-host-death family protein